MTRHERTAWLSLPVILTVGVGLAIAGGIGGARIGSVSIFTLGVLVAFVVQWIVFLPSYLAGSERFFDLTGSFTYVSVTAISILLSPTPGVRSWLLLVLVLIWAARLGSFLYRRVRRAGKDGRFDALKTSFPRFLMTWTLQGLWVSFTLAAALAAITSSVRAPFGVISWLGLVVWMLGFGIEVIADEQKRRFRAGSRNAGSFIRTGLWAWSRHPNYFGEIMVWFGVALLSLPVLRGWQYVALISPVFVFLLLTRISGIPLLEKRADEKWSGQEDYERYKRTTPVLVPRPPRSR